jgi:hypothetical protein
MKSNQAEAAKMIREILKKEFPNIKFSVKSEGYSMGDNVRVTYCDSVKSEDVQNKISQFQYGNFNGMEDIYEYSNSRDDIPQTKYLFVTREMSEPVKNKIINYIQKRYEGCEGLSYGDYCEHFREWFSVLVHREFCKRDFSVINFDLELI